MNCCKNSRQIYDPFCGKTNKKLKMNTQAGKFLTPKGKEIIENVCGERIKGHIEICPLAKSAFST